MNFCFRRMPYKGTQLGMTRNPQSAQYNVESTAVEHHNLLQQDAGLPVASTPPLGVRVRPE